ncbi:hypothetical protein FKP32DRAFT_1760029 [Trametes sanguinea]|nr:hypothetical protein FKP32DRAFT_1760029 [Trametes sanguinea]
MSDHDPLGRSLCNPCWADMDTEGRIPLIDPSEHAQQFATADPVLTAGRATWNARQRINTLPIETLTEILSYLGIEPIDDFDYFFRCPNSAEWFRLRLVCRHWWVTVNSNPRFWRKIFVDQGDRWWDLVVARSGNAGVLVYFHFIQSLPSSIASKILADKDRIGHFELSCHRTCQAVGMLPFLEATLPSLTSVNLALLPFEEGFPPYEFMPEKYPRLARIELFYIKYPWTVSALTSSHLRSLHLKKCNITPSGIQLTDFLRILGCAEQLEELHLEYVMSTCWPEPHTSTEGDLTSVIPLPRNLRDLRLSDTPQWICRFLSQVELPSQACRITVSVRITLNLVDEYSRLVQYASFFPDELESRMHHFRTATKVALSVRSSDLLPVCWDISCEAPGPREFILRFACRPDAMVSMPGDHGSQAISYVIRHFRASPLEVLELALEEPQLENTSVLRELICTFPDISKVVIRFAGSRIGSSAAMQFCDTLLQGNGPGPGDPAMNGVSLPWPKLESVHIGGLDWCDGAFLPVLLQRLSQRMVCGAPRLKSLSLTIYRRNDRHKDWSFVDVLFESVLRVFATRCTYTIRLLPCR